MDYLETTEWHPVQLPSMGRWYGDALPEGKVQITPWTVAQEEMLTRRLTGDSKDPTHDLLRGNTKFALGFSYEDLLLTDQFFLLLQLRCISFLSFMTLPYECKCGAVTHIDVELPDIGVKTAEPEDPDMPFDIVLPKSKIPVGLRFQTIGDVIAADRYVEESAKPEQFAHRKFLYARQLATIDGAADRTWEEKMEIIAKLPIFDLNAIVRTCDRHSSGFRGTYPAQCSSCDASDTGWVPPIHEDFFRPKPTDIDRAMQLAELPRKGSELPCV